jgi:hypothetical protein
MYDWQLVVYHTMVRVNLNTLPNRKLTQQVVNILVHFV